MFILDPITQATSPAGQAARLLNREVAGSGSTYSLAASIGSTGATPRVIMGQIVGLPARARLGFRVRSGGTAASVAGLGFNAVPIALNTETIGGREYILPSEAQSGVFFTPQGHFLMVIDRMPPGDPQDAEIVLVSPGTDASLALAWFLDLRLLVAAYPTPALRVRLRRPRTTVTSITGRVWVTERTTEPVLEAVRVPLNNEYRLNLPAELAELDAFSQFSVWPAGFERVFRSGAPVLDHRAHNFVRDCAVRTWTGWRGHGDIDIHGATGEMTLSEIPWPSSARLEIPTVVRRPSLPGVIPRPTGTPVAPPHGAQETIATWEGGIPVDWAPDLPVGWEND